MLCLDNLGHAYDHKLLFRSLNACLPQGSRVLLCGTNGCGKSTLLHILAGLLAPSAGSFSFGPDANCNAPHAALDQEGHDNKGVNPWHSVLLGHSTFLYPSLTVWENLNFWVGLEKTAYQQSALDSRQNQQAKIEETLCLLDLQALKNEKVSTLSKGMAQRLTLGRLYLSSARLWLLDEPESGLDKDALPKLITLVLAQKHRVVMWASHSLTASYTVNTGKLFTHRLCLAAKQPNSPCEAELQKLLEPPRQADLSETAFVPILRNSKEQTC